MNPIPEGKVLIQFDGICVLCSRAVRFLLKVDRKKRFVFQSLQETSDKTDFETIRVVDNNQTFTYFDALLKIGRELGGVFRAVAIFKILPQSWRKALYLLIARNRFRWFGKNKECFLPTESERERFI